MKRVFISDCEGPISKNDNAFELTAYYVPDGAKLFTVISSYDDVLADVLKRKGYKAGDTLKLILPFLKAYGATDNEMQRFSASNLVLIPYVKDVLHHIRSFAYAFIVSTSYEHYIRALCQAICFPYSKTCSTKLNMDKYPMTPEEKTRLRELAKEIAQMPIIEIPAKAESIQDLSENHHNTVKRLDEIFWKEMTSMQVGRMYSEVNPVGGIEKAEAIRKIAKETDVSFSDVMYVGDSITDEEAFRLIRENGGLTVSFNGNRYAIENAEVAVLSENSLVTAVLAEVFCNSGKEQALQLVENWSVQTLKKSGITPELLNQFLRVHPRKLPKVKIITNENMQTLSKQSSEFRKKVRGEAIGRLG